MACCKCCCENGTPPGECCGSPSTCCKEPDVCCGPIGSKTCCEDPRVCCGVGSGQECCPEGDLCCGEECCPPSQECCGEGESQVCCNEGQYCCDGVCEDDPCGECDPPCDECETCVDNECVATCDVYPCDCVLATVEDEGGGPPGLQADGHQRVDLFGPRNLVLPQVLAILAEYEAEGAPNGAFDSCQCAAGVMLTLDCCDGTCPESADGCPP
jgi:hypothetical protein